MDHTDDLDRIGGNAVNHNVVGMHHHLPGAWQSAGTINQWMKGNIGRGFSIRASNRSAAVKLSVPIMKS